MKVDLNKWRDISYSYTERLNIVNMSILPMLCIEYNSYQHSQKICPTDCSQTCKKEFNKRIVLSPNGTALEQLYIDRQRKKKKNPQSKSHILYKNYKLT